MPISNAEHALGFDVSLRGRGSRFEGELTYFRNDISDYIFRRPTGEVEDDFPVVENVAADSVLSGIEAHADVKLTNELTAEVTYDWVQGELKTPAIRCLASRPFRVLGGLTYQKNAFQVGGSAQVVADQDRVFGEEIADRRLYHGEVLRRVFLHARRRTQYHYRAIGQRHRQAVSQPSELLEGRAAGNRPQLQGGLFGGV